MAENSNQPKNFDAVLGGQTPPPVGGVVLGGIEGWRRRFATPIVEQRIAVLLDALKYGDAGINLLIEAMNDEALLVRANAYKLLQGLSSAKAQQAIAKGVLLNEGDRLYSVYQSAIYYGDDWYYINDYISEFYADDRYLDPQFVSRHFLRETAEVEAELFHKVRLLEIDVSGLYREKWSGNNIDNFDLNQWCVTKNLSFFCQANEERETCLERLINTLEESKKKELLLKLWDDLGKNANIDINEWCAETRVTLVRQEDEQEWQFENRVFQKFQNDKNSEILNELWQWIGFGRRLAFVHEEIFSHKAYFKHQGNL
ncbi:hypothetical protein H6S82_11135 [Planktothrix sp. FACHB-1355]|uniref:Uncharacterized protein n=1 Tax=Aerosakkonema funiforme FACHB-1375 TaxID=2949571 RepID=A0A926VIV3_9CYAN|nr:MULTISPECIES: hypothetical protein [Oscillatoriales]MBD2183993.1 hypothetical protein [Aerosakkonema funiforme FACHB-1375]MBD3559414.1 hypothetical protein [Planktothrix sp. FACHB-1355]